MSCFFSNTEPKSQSFTSLYVNVPTVDALVTMGLKNDGAASYSLKMGRGLATFALNTSFFMSVESDRLTIMHASNNQTIENVSNPKRLTK